jgi:hypothetical protein
VIAAEFADAPGPSPWCRRPQDREPEPSAGKRASSLHTLAWVQIPPGARWLKGRLYARRWGVWGDP